MPKSDTSYTTERFLSAVMSNPLYRERIVPYRGDSEREYIHIWLNNTSVIVDKTDESVQTIIKNCTQCGATTEKKLGIGQGTNGLMIILHSPSLMSNFEINVLKKESATLLKKMILATEFNFDECYITNMVKCAVSNPLISPGQVVKNCREILLREIAVYKPKIIIVFGDIIPLQKIIKDSTGIFWYNIEHPMTLIKNPELKRSAWKTLQVIIQKGHELSIS